MNKKNLYNEIGKNIKKRREELGISQNKLAEFTNLSPSFIVMIESSTCKYISISILNQIAKALKISLENLLPYDYDIIKINEINNESGGLITEAPTEFFKIRKTPSYL